MKFKYSAPSILIGATLVTVGLISYISLNLSAKLVDSAEEGQFKMMRSIVDFNLKSNEAKALARAEIVASMPAVKAALAAGDRPRLLAETTEMYKVQNEKYGLDQSQFIVPPTTSFLRLNAPDRHGDDLSSFRPIVVDVSRNKEVRKGVTVTRSGPGVFGVVPVRNDQGQFLGIFEMGLSFAPILDGLKAAYGFEMALFVEEKILKDTATNLGGDILTQENRFGQYIRLHSTHKELLSTLVTEEDVNVTDEVRYVRNSGSVPYGVMIIPLFNYVGKQIGLISVGWNFSATRSAKGQLLVWQGLMAIFGCVFLAATILVVIRGALLKPLSAVTKQLHLRAQGGEPGEAGAFADCCDEIQEFAATCEEILDKTPKTKSQPLPTKWKGVGP